MSLKFGPATPPHQNGAPPRRPVPVTPFTNVQNQAKTKNSSALKPRKSQNPVSHYKSIKKLGK